MKENKVRIGWRGKGGEDGLPGGSLFYGHYNNLDISLEDPLWDWDWVSVFSSDLFYR
jgi:hypothetical protein